MQKSIRSAATGYGIRLMDPSTGRKSRQRGYVRLRACMTEKPTFDLVSCARAQGTNKVAYIEKWKPSDVDNVEYVAGSAPKV